MLLGEDEDEYGLAIVPEEDSFKMKTLKLNMERVSRASPLVLLATNTTLT